MAEDWQGDEFIEGLKAQLGINLEKAAIYLKEKVKMALNEPQAYERYVGENGVYYTGLGPSTPGNPPKKITGFLQRSIAHEMSDDKLSAFVGTGVVYGLYLETGTVKMAARPFLSSTLLTERATVDQIIRTGKR